MTWSRLLALAALVLGVVGLVLCFVDETQTAVYFASAGAASAGGAMLV